MGRNYTFESGWVLERSADAKTVKVLASIVYYTFFTISLLSLLSHSIWMLFGTTEVIGAVWHIQKYTNNKNVDLNFNKIQGGVSKTENTYKYQENHFDYYGKLLLPLDSGLAIFLKFFSETARECL